MDLCLFGLEHGIPADDVARRAGLKDEQVETVWRDIKSKRAATRYLHEAPLLVEKCSPT